MSTTYKIKGRRFIRKYTAPKLSPSTAAGSDVAAISDRFCDVPWTQAQLDVYPEFPSYATSKVDENAAIRDCFDAAEWCGEHDDSRMHRAFANAAIYRFRLPAGQTLESVTVKVTCDPYTPQGARIATMCTDSDDLPTDCSFVRTMAAHHDGVARRTAVTNSSTRAVTWYETTASKTLTLNSTGKKWLLVFIGLEDYRARNGWLEGAAKVDSVSATFADDVDGWDEDSQVDLRFEGSPSVALAGGSSPTWLQPLHMLASAGKDGTDHTSVDRYLFIKIPARNGDDIGFYLKLSVSYYISTRSFSLNVKTILTTYDGTFGTFNKHTPNSSATVTSTNLTFPAELNGVRIGLDDTVFKIKSIGTRYESTTSVSYGLEFLCFPVVSEGRIFLHLFSKSTESDSYEESKNSPIDFGEVDEGLSLSLDSSTSVRPDGASDESFGDMSWQIATADVQTGSRSASDTFLHIIGMTRNLSEGVAHDYAFASGAFPQDQLDRVTVVPRFVRASSLPSGQSDKSQPGISLWYHKGSRSVVYNSVLVGTRTENKPNLCCSNLSFLQGCFLAVRAPSDGNKIRLSATGSVSCSGIALRLDVWKSSGAQWDGTAGFHNAQRLVAATGFVDGSESNVLAPSHSWKDDSYYSGMQDTGGFTAQLIGSSDTVSSTISEHGQIDISLESPVSEGDVIIINPVPVGLADGFTGTDAWFGRTGDPSTEETKSWCRYSQNLGWYPKIEIM